VNIANSASLQLSGGMTLEAWVDAARVTSAWRDVIYKANDNYYLEATSDNAGLPAGGGIMGGSHGEAYGTKKLTANSWTYLSLTYDGSAVRLYVNGSLVSTTAKSGALATSTNQLQIGGDSLYGQYFSGLIDEVRVYNTALSAGQIQTDMVTPISGGTSDTQAPTQPGTLGANAASSSTINLSWGASSDNVGVTGYQIERCQGSGCSNFSQIATTTGSTTSYSDTSLTANTGYSYRVRATDAAGNTSPYSNTATITTPSTSLHLVGGTVSGLAGTLVLENNGGDDLTLANNGSFSFNTRLADGATYQVTVKTPPSGQTCAVSGASGTMAGADVTNVAVVCTSSSGTFDDFNRPDGSLGAAWTPISDGGLSIASGVAVGTSAQAGDIRSGEAYGGDQFSSVEVTNTQISGGQWLGAAVRMQNGGQNMYLGIYFWNNGTPQLRLYERNNGTWTQLGNSYNCGALPAGTTLKLTAVGSTIAFFENGTQRIAATDTTVTGGAPGVATYGAAQLDNWAGGNATTPADTTPPSQPGTLGANAASSSTINLSWGASSDNVGVTGYQIERCQGSGCSNFSQIATTTGSTTSYSDTSLTANTGYSYRVRATDAAGNTSPYSNTATITTPSTSLHLVGGTVSGLAGTLVLENNGGDDLTLANNGSFSFNTRLADGATYQVTVKTPPSGQTCAVSGASGTMAGADVTNVAVVCTSSSGTFDDFNRPDGSLGAAWTPISDGGLSIASGVAVGTSAQAGDIRSGEAYGGDQFSSVEVTNTQISGGQWLGAAVRMQNGGQNMYLGIYFWNNGTPQLRLYERNNGTWTQLGNSYNCGALPAGTTLKLTAVGSTIAFFENGTQRIAATDTTVTGGAPGVATYGAAQLDNWAGGNATAPPAIQVVYDSTAPDGVVSYDVTSSDDGGTHVMRVLAPTNPAPGVPHSFLYVLPVEAELGSVYGDGIESLRALGVQNQYNLTIIEPSFGIEPWYADNPVDSSAQYETFLTKDLVPWVTQNLGTSGTEQNWLIGFSKSGIGATDLILKHPDVFTLAAAWDFPADMSTYDQFGASSADNYGTNANFQANYRLTPAFVSAHKAPFLSQNRIWIGGYQAFQTDMSDFDGLLISDGILHTTETPTPMAHRWDSGWTPIALAALRQESMALVSGS
jgi:hypothetical protein